MIETLAQQITGVGRGAVATILLVGPNADKAVQRCFQPSSKSVRLTLNRIYFGKWIWQKYQEELVVTRTSTESYEIHCHGGYLATKTILNSLADCGVTLVDESQWLQEPSLDRFAAEAKILLPTATTIKATAILLDQSRRAVAKELSMMQEWISQHQKAKSKRALQQILSYALLGKRITGSFEVAVLGVANSGKSSLVNAILGFERSIVYDAPGTTRDLVATKTALQGWPITFFDTAGLRETDNRAENIGIVKAQVRADRADLVLHIVDLESVTPDQDPWQPSTSQTVPIIRVGTKSDLIKIDNQPLVDVATSAVTLAGIDELCALIANKLVPNPPDPGQPIPVTGWQEDVLSDLLALVQAEKMSEAGRRVNQLLP